ncbi:MAG: hypothetical protein HFH00_01470 [Dorea sp.]|nr:hypothetical protein [Dorea sp.]
MQDHRERQMVELPYGANRRMDFRGQPEIYIENMACREPNPLSIRSVC